MSLLINRSACAASLSNLRDFRTVGCTSARKPDYNCLRYFPVLT